MTAGRETGLEHQLGLEAEPFPQVRLGTSPEQRAVLLGEARRGLGAERFKALMSGVRRGMNACQRQGFTRGEHFVMNAAKGLELAEANGQPKVYLAWAVAMIEEGLL